MSRAAANNILTDGQLVRHARDASRRAMFCLRAGNRTGAWNEWQLAADLVRAAKPLAVPRRRKSREGQ
jgi:hypothetical protein